MQVAAVGGGITLVSTRPTKVLIGLLGWWVGGAKREEGMWRAGNVGERAREVVLREYYNANAGGR